MDKWAAGADCTDCTRKNTLALFATRNSSRLHKSMWILCIVNSVSIESSRVNSMTARIDWTHQCKRLYAVVRLLICYIITMYFDRQQSALILANDYNRRCDFFFFFFSVSGLLTCCCFLFTSQPSQRDRWMWLYRVTTTLFWCSIGMLGWYGARRWFRWQCTNNVWYTNSHISGPTGMNE